MTHAYVIEIEDETVGLIVQRNGDGEKAQGYRFYAASPRFRAIEGRIFGGPEKARKAAAALYEKPSSKTTRRRYVELADAASH